MSGRFWRRRSTDPTRPQVVGGGAETPIRRACLNTWEQWNRAVAERLIKRYGHLMAHVPVKSNPKLPRPAATLYRWDTGTLEVQVNDAMLDGTSDETKTAVMIHEFLHVLCNHFQRMLSMDSGIKTDPEIMRDANVAADMAINPFIPKLPRSLPAVPSFTPCLPAQQGWDDGESMEWYYERVRAQRPRQQKQGQSGEQDDPTGHQWGKGEGKPSEKDDQGNGEGSPDPSTLEQMAKAANNTRRKVFKELLDEGLSPNQVRDKLLPQGTATTWGTSSGDLKISHIVSGAGTLSWNMEMRSIGDGLPTAINFRWSNMRRDKRFGTRPGLTFERQGKVLAALDTSSSVTGHRFGNTPAIQVMLAELVKLYQSVKQIDVVMADTRIKDVVLNYRGNRKITIRGGGGTNYNCVFQWMEEQKRKYSMLIFFGDGETYPVDDRWKKLNVPTLWVTLPNGQPHDEYCSFGKTVWMTAPE